MNKEGSAVDFNYFSFVTFLLLLLSEKIQYLNPIRKNPKNRRTTFQAHTIRSASRSWNFQPDFMTVLSGHLAESSSPAVILLVLWLLLTNCYAWILRMDHLYYKFLQLLSARLLLLS